MYLMQNMFDGSVRTNLLSLQVWVPHIMATINILLIEILLFLFSLYQLLLEQANKFVFGKSL
jgi:hypothetical protein